MKSYRDRVRLVLVFIVLLTLFVTYFAVYLPMAHEIEKNAIEQFKIISESKVHTFNETINKNVQGAKSLSSRSAIRNKVDEYLEGHIDLETLQTFTRDKYLDGVSVIEDVIYAVRVGDGYEIVRWSEDDAKMPDRLFTGNHLSYAFRLEEDNVYLDVVSPIITHNGVVGHDYIGYCINRIIKVIESEGIGFSIGRESDLNQVVGYDHIYEDDMSMYYVSPLNHEFSAIVHLTKKEIFKNKDYLTVTILRRMVASYAVILIFVYLGLIKFFREKIEDLSLDRDVYKHYADLDELTGAYTRIFLNEYMKHHPAESCILVLLDLDDFKNINDRYGHVMGDEVLKFIVKTIEQVVRYEDIVVRFGGDEFLIVLRSHSKEGALSVIKRIKLELANQKHFEFKVDFSYGIAEVPASKELYSHIELADKAMYMDKKSKKT